MISSTPIDVMHNLDLGITRKILLLLFSKDAASKSWLPALMSLATNCLVPSEYSRRGRITEIGRLKAAELMHYAKGLGADVGDLILRMGRYSKRFAVLLLSN